MRFKSWASPAILSLAILVVAGFIAVPAEAQRGGRGRGGGPGGGGRGGPPPEVDLDSIRMPPGFQIRMYTDSVPGARSLALGDQGTVFVGTFGLLTGQGNIGAVYAVRDNDDDGVADEVLTVAEGLNQPNGVAFHEGDLYVAEMQRVLRYADIESRLADPPAPTVIADGMLDAGNHQWRYIEFGPDGKLYLAKGAPCNVCEPEESYGAIVRMNPDGSDLEVYARGVRNSVGLAFHPTSGDLWFTDNGRDMLGDNIPADELNHASGAGQHFGFPYCHQGDVPDPEFGSPAVCEDYTRPAVKMGPHVAALGLDFYTGDMFPATYRNELFIAQHGSWNRSTPLGYRIVLAHVSDQGTAAGQLIFAEGWLQNGQAWGRPSDVLTLPDGSLLVSDDLQGNIYRITYGD
jgi:glucose/arabinose dehydrogenase